MRCNFHLGSWLVQPAEGLISKDGASQPIAIKAMAVLEVLASANGEAVTRQVLMDSVWPNQEVTDDVLTGCISILRRALGDDRRENRYIATLPKRGYRLLMSVVEIDRAGPANKQASDPVTASASVKRRLWGALIAGAAIVIVWAWMAATPSVKAPPDDRSIAVLPLDVFSDSAEVAHFARGLEEELIHQLARSPGIRVIARTSSSKIVEQYDSVLEIGRILNVRHVLEGSVRDGPDGIRITVQLIDASTEFHLWSQVFDVQGERLIEIQEQVGKAVISLVAHGTEVAQSSLVPRHPVHDSAYRLFLLGESHMRVGTVDAYREASRYFSDAIRIAPDYALAYARLAAAYLLLYQYDYEPLDEASNKALKALDTALSIDPMQPEATAVKGLLYTYRKDYAVAESYLQRAIELQPNLRSALHNYGFMLWRNARYAEALVYLRQALLVDPLSNPTNYLVGDSLAGMGEFDKARTHYLKCEKLLPEYYACPAGLAAIERLLGEHTEAIKTLQRAGKLEPDGFYWQHIGVSALAIEAGDFELAGTRLAAASEMIPLEYALLRLRLLHRLGTGRLGEFADQLRQLRADNLTDRDLKLIGALTEYFSANCPAAVKLYEAELQQSTAALIDVWDLASGFSHATALAYCYGSLGKTEDQARVMALIEQYLATSAANDFPGGLYLRVNYHRLAGDAQGAENALDLLQKRQWPLLWLADLEPLGHSSQ